MGCIHNKEHARIPNFTNTCVNFHLQKKQSARRKELHQILECLSVRWDICMF